MVRCAAVGFVGRLRLCWAIIIVMMTFNGPVHGFRIASSTTTRPGGGPASMLVKNPYSTVLSPHHRQLRQSSLMYTELPVLRAPSTTAVVLREKMEKLVLAYVNQCEQRPFRTKSLTAATVQGLGDLLSQALAAFVTGSVFRWNIMRTLTFMAIGLFYKGPALHVWYKILGRISQWTGKTRGFTDLQQSLTSLALDQTIGVAIFYPLYYFVYETISAVITLQTPNLVAVASHLSTKIVPVVMAQYYVWPAAQYLSFRYCPAPLRVLYTNAVAVFWNIFLCAKLAA